MPKKLDKEEKKWWVRPPRSSRICLRCNHKYSSHIDVRCLKLVSRKPERIECTCKGFVSSEEELQMVLEREERIKAKNMLLSKNKEDITCL